MKMDYLSNYDKSDPKSIELYAQKLRGKTFQQVLDDDKSDDKENANNRGDLGQLIERHHFHYACNNDSNPDFAEAGVELKVTPFKKNKNDTYSAKERLVLTKINYHEIVHELFETSHMWRKSRLILLIYYLYQKNIGKRYDYEIKYSKLFIPPEEDVLIIKKDFETIVEKVKLGRAHEISERDTMYLSACTKGAKGSDRTSQPYSDALAKPRAFSFKTSYMTYILNSYIIPGKDTYIKVADCNELKKESFEDVLKRKLSVYEGMYESQILKLLNLNINEKNKGYASILVCNMLGVKSTRVEEFAKAGIVVKIIKYCKNKANNQHLRLEDFRFKDLDDEEFDDEILDPDTQEPVGWEDSELYDYVKNRKYLFVVFWEEQDGSVFKGSQLWGTPDEDAEIVHTGWNKLKRIVREGVRLQPKRYGKGIHIENNLPGITDNGVFHIRPHAKNSYYELNGGMTYGNGTISDSDVLPDGRRLTKQAYWLNRNYIDSQINDELKKEY